MRKQVNEIYWQIVEISRQPVLYKNYGIQDTIDGRFDSLMLHIYPMLSFLKRNNQDKLATELLNIMVADMDRSLRQSGVGDPSIARKMRHIGEAYCGRITAYTNGFDALPNEEILQEAIFRNVYRSKEESKKYIPSLSKYMIKYNNGFETYKWGNKLDSLVPNHLEVVL